MAGNPAGVRTHVFMSAAAACFLHLANHLLLRFNLTTALNIQSDPIRWRSR